MKIISLNAWQGKVDIVQNFIKDEKNDTDIFCFQESTDTNGEVFCAPLLKNYQLVYATKVLNDFDIFEQATFIKEDLKVFNTTAIGQGDVAVGLGLLTQIETPNGNINICNVHGIARPGDKKDTPARLRQSQMILDFFQDLSGPKIIMGDFNLDLNIKSVDIFKKYGFKNLIEEFNIPTTRNHLAWDNYKDKQFFADHFFVSPEIKPTKFSVPNINISDHLPMILEFEVNSYL